LINVQLLTKINNEQGHTIEEGTLVNKIVKRNVVFGSFKWKKQKSSIINGHNSSTACVTALFGDGGVGQHKIEEGTMQPHKTRFQLLPLEGFNLCFLMLMFFNDVNLCLFFFLLTKSAISD